MCIAASQLSPFSDQAHGPSQAELAVTELRRLGVPDTDNPGLFHGRGLAVTSAADQYVLKHS